MFLGKGDRSGVLKGKHGCSVFGSARGRGKSQGFEKWGLEALQEAEIVVHALLLLFTCSVVSNSLRPRGLQASLSFTLSRNLIKLRSVESTMLSNHLILYCPLLLPSLSPNIMVCSSELALHIRWSKYWSFSNTPSSEYSRQISFRIDWFDLLAVQGTLKSRCFQTVVMENTLET